MKTLKNTPWVVCACLLFCYAIFGSTACAMEYNIPHVTGGQANWTDELVVDNMGDATEDFWVHLYNAGGGEALNRKFTIPSMETMTIRLKDYATNAQCGCVVTDNSVTPINGVACLRFRLRYTSDVDGIAEFELSPMNKSQMAFNFSEHDAIDWKGLAVMNTDPTTAATTCFYAIYNNGTLSQPQNVVINPNCKLVGYHTAWFPTIATADIQSIIVSSVSASLCGVCISGADDNSRLLFTQAGDATRFRETDINTRYMVDSKLLEGSWVFNLYFTTWNETWCYHYDFNRLSGVTNAETGYRINGVNGFGEALTRAEYLPTTGRFEIVDTSVLEFPGNTTRREYEFNLDAPSTERDYYSITGGTVRYYYNNVLQQTATFDGRQVNIVVNNNPDVDE